MNDDEKKKLDHTVKRVAELMADKKTADEEIKELCEELKEKQGTLPKVTKQLAKELNWNEIERAAQRLLEEELDSCRTALGLLADLPLGEHAQERERKRHQPREKRKPELVN